MNTVKCVAFSRSDRPPCHTSVGSVPAATAGAAVTYSSSRAFGTGLVAP